MAKTTLFILIYLSSLALLFVYLKMMIAHKKNRVYFSGSAKIKKNNYFIPGLMYALNSFSEKIGKSVIHIMRLKDLKKYSDFLAYFNSQNTCKLNEKMIIGYKCIIALLALTALIIFFKGNLLGIFFSLAMSLMGFFLPDLMIKKIESLKIKKIEKELPYIIDLLYITTLSGQNIYQSIEILNQNHRGPLCFEFEKFLRDVDMGSGKKSAYENMLKSHRSNEFKSFVMLLMQTEEHGCKASDLLKQKSKFIAFKNIDLLNKKIKTTNLKMLFPIIFLILPSFILLVCGPIFYLIGGNIFFSK
jgi:tight adherence protein C